MKLADFGFARNMGQADLAATLCGSPLYMAPEILFSEKYSDKADVWSFGMTLYFCLYGRPAHHQSRNVLELQHNVRTKPVTYPKNIHLSPDLLDLMLNCLVVDPLCRLTWPELFMHPWLTDEPCILNSMTSSNMTSSNMTSSRVTLSMAIPSAVRPDSALSFTPPKVIDDYDPIPESRSHPLTERTPLNARRPRSYTSPAAVRPPEPRAKEIAKDVAEPAIAMPRPSTLGLVWDLLKSWSPI